MTNITIGATGPDWRVAAKARYYAQRGDGEEYAFGTTPADALAKLETREAASRDAFDASLAEEIAFLALGAADALKAHRGESLDAYDGYMGFIGEVIRHAPLLSKRWRRMDAESFGGAWLYDVTERFGHVWAEELLRRTGASPADKLEAIVEEVLREWR